MTLSSKTSLKTNSSSNSVKTNEQQVGKDIMTKQMETFYNKLNQFIEDWTQSGWLEDEQWDAEEFKECFVKNMPKLQEQVKTKTKTKTKQNKSKDPSKPKRAKGAYIFFSSDPEIRQSIKNENPDASSSDIMRLIGSLWSSDEYKNYHDEGEQKDKIGKFDYTSLADKYLNMAAIDKKRHMDEMESYIPDPDFVAEVKPKRVAKRKGVRARSAYMFFCMENRADVKAEIIESASFQGRELQTETTKMLGELWNEYKNYHDEGGNKDKVGKFDYTDKVQKYIDMAEQDKSRDKSLSDIESEDDTKSDNDTKSEDDTKSDNEDETSVSDLLKGVVLELENAEDNEEEIEEEIEEETEGEIEEEIRCDYVYSRNSKKSGKKKGEICGEICGECGRCSKHRRRVSN